MNLLGDQCFHVGKVNFISFMVEVPGMILEKLYSEGIHKLYCFSMLVDFLDHS